MKNFLLILLMFTAKTSLAVEVSADCVKAVDTAVGLLSSGCEECCKQLVRVVSEGTPPACEPYHFSDLDIGIQKKLTNQSKFQMGDGLPEVYGTLLGLVKNKASQNSCIDTPPEVLAAHTDVYVVNTSAKFAGEAKHSKELTLAIGETATVTTPKNKYQLKLEWVTTSVYPTGILRTKVSPMPAYNDFKVTGESFSYGESCSAIYTVKKDPSKTIDIKCTVKKQGPVVKPSPGVN